MPHRTWPRPFAPSRVAEPEPWPAAGNEPIASKAPANRLPKHMVADRLIQTPIGQYGPQPAVDKTVRWLGHEINGGLAEFSVPATRRDAGLPHTMRDLVGVPVASAQPRWQLRTLARAQAGEPLS